MVKINNEHGEIAISSDVFTSLAGDAATNCFGVKGMTVRSITDGLVHLLKPEYKSKGVHIKHNDDGSITIELHIAVDQGVNIPVVCESIRNEVNYKVSKGTGVDIKRIDIFVDSMLLG
ncbi:MAG: Asp23/Gls24 family envelope stress response protein [Oscillospiraceae bacterium]|jgi:uncharacterized alkaline shock family protein YloU|nr:Asp23/Gls24 family envelope stress response protein [Oscillospiraceae bacterium]